MAEDQRLALIVEDDNDIATLLAASVRAAGFTTEVIGAGPDALRRLEQVTPELIILDLLLPGVDGEKILRHIRDEERLAHVRVIVVSGAQYQAQQLQSLADFVLIKPISLEHLRALVARLFPA
jgi:DNA-binding response OmpR family regulator